LNEVTRRRVLEPLARLARDTNAAIVLIRHLRKHGAGTPALQRGLGSSDIPAIARVMLLVGVDPENEERRVLACSKNNLAERPASLGFRIVGTDSGVARLEWLGPSPLTADELVEKPRRARRDAVSAAMDFLRERLADGPCTRSQLLDEAAALGLSLRTLERAKAELGILSRQGRDNGAKAWYWSLGEMPEAAAGDSE
jgi:hypothetical protein